MTVALDDSWVDSDPSARLIRDRSLMIRVIRWLNSALSLQKWRGRTRAMLSIRGQRLVMLIVYFVTNLGLPLDFLGLTPTASAAGVKSRVASQCCCSAETRQTDRCCCSKPAMALGCCATKAKPAETTSCCATKTPKSKPATTPKPSRDRSPAWSSDCDCGQSDSPLLLCHQPRILNHESSVVFWTASERLERIAPSVPCGERPAPCVPPPEFLFIW